MYNCFNFCSSFAAIKSNQSTCMPKKNTHRLIIKMDNLVTIANKYFSTSREISVDILELSVYSSTE